MDRVVVMAVEVMVTVVIVATEGIVVILPVL